MPKLLSKITIVFLFCFISSNLGAQDRDDYARELESSRNKINTIDSSIRIDSKKSREINGQIKKLDQQISKLESRIKSLSKRIQSKEQELKRLDENLVIQRRHTVSQKQLLAKQILTAYQMGHQTGLQLILSQDNPATYSRMSVYSDYYSRARQHKITGALYSVQRLAETHLQTAVTRKSLLSSKQKMSQSVKSKSNEQRSRKRLVAQLESGIISKKDQKNQLLQNIARLQALVEELDRQKLLADQAFFGNQGDLPWPVEGQVTASFGDLKSSGKLRWNGVFFKAPAGQHVHAVANGEIVYADWLNGFGRLLIVNHGNGYMSLYGGNQELLTDTGVKVESGQVIASVGDTSGHSGSGLYFEIRKDAHPLNPEEWISPRMQFAKTTN